MSSKNKLMFVMALLLFSLAAPIVQAAIMDTITAPIAKINDYVSDHKFIIINTIVIAVLLIAIIAMYPEGKLGKSQRGILQTIAIAVAFFIAWKLSPDRYLWELKNISALILPKVLVNIGILSAVFFIALNIPWLQKKLPEKGIGKWAMYLIAIAIAVLIAIQPLKDVTGRIDITNYVDYNYIWEAEWFTPWRFRLIGDSHCYAFDGYGFKDGKANFLTTKGRVVYKDSEDKWKEDVRFFDKNIDLEEDEKISQRIGEFVGSDGKDYFFDRKGILKEDNIFGNPVASADILEREKDNVLLYDKIQRGQLRFDQLPKGLKGVARAVDDEEKGGRYCYTQQSLDAVKQKTYREMGDYIAYDSKEPRIIGFGILRGRQLVVFVFGLLVLIWLFNTLNVGGERKEINYFISILLAYSMAHEGISWSWFVWLMEVIVWFLLYKGMSKGGATENVKINAFLSLLLTYLIFKFAFPQDHFTIAWLEGLGIFGFLIVAIVGILFFTFFKGKGGEGEKKRRWRDIPSGLPSTVHDIGLNIRNRIAGLLEKSPVAKVYLKETLGWSKKKIRKDTFPWKEKETYLLQTLMNYMLRLEVFGSKRNAVRQRALQVPGLQKKLGVHFSLNRYLKQMEMFLGGKRVKIIGEEEDYGKEVEEGIKKLSDEDLQNKKGTTADGIFDEPITNIGSIKRANEYHSEVHGEEHMVDKSPTGGLSIYKFVIRAIKILIEEELVPNKLREEAPRASAKLATDIHDRIKPDLLEKDFSAEIEEDLKKFKTYFDKYQRIKQVRGVAQEQLDQYLMYGDFKHIYSFVRPNAEVGYYDIKDVKPLDSDNLIGVGTNKWEIVTSKELEYTKKAGSDIKVIDKEQTTVYQQADTDGIFLEDKNIIVNARKIGKSLDEIKKELREKTGKSEVRKVDIWRYTQGHEKDYTIMDVGNFAPIMSGLKTAWKAFIDDLEHGKYHPNSKTYNDYRIAWDKYKDYKYEHVKNEVVGERGEDRPVFDMEALKDPGNFHYWGRKNYWEGEGTINKKPENPYPGLSTLGLSEFVSMYFENEWKPKKRVRKLLNLYVRQTQKKRFVRAGEEEEKNE